LLYAVRSLALLAIGILAAAAAESPGCRKMDMEPEVVGIHLIVLWIPTRTWNASPEGKMKGFTPVGEGIEAEVQAVD
jgi:hypothetical protein